MNARDRGALMYKLADEMDMHREELATLNHTVLIHVYLCYGELCMSEWSTKEHTQ